MSARQLTLAVTFVALALTTLDYELPKADGSTDFYVDPTGYDTNSCVFPSAPCKTIQAAVTKVAYSGGTIHLAAGTYSTSSNGETFPIAITQTLSLVGHGRTTTFIDATGSGQNVISASGGDFNVSISSVTIEGGNRGIELAGTGNCPYFCIHAQISDNKITLNTIGVFAAYSVVDVIQNDFMNNIHYGIYYDHSTRDVSRNIFEYNCTGGIPSYDAAIYLSYSSPIVVNNLIEWNYGSGIYSSHSSPSITNNSIWRNYGGSGVAAFNSPLPGPEIINNNIYWNGLYGIHTDGIGTLTNSYNDVWHHYDYADYQGTTGGTGSISSDPKFVSLSDAHLMCSSPAINAGNNSAYYAPSVDYDGNPRPVGGIIDMGAYEKQTDLFCPLHLPLIMR